MSEQQSGGTDQNDDEWVRQSVIDLVKDGETHIARSGAWAAERVEEYGEIRVYRVDEVIDLD